VHSRCGEIRRVPVSFENDSRRERPVTLTLDSFVTRGGVDLKWKAALSETAFTLKPCEEQTVTVTVLVNCNAFKGVSPAPGEGTGSPSAGPIDKQPGAGVVGTVDNGVVLARAGSVDRCEVGYATLRAEGCSVRPMVIAVAVLPDDCDSYRNPCHCGCCH
jgi:hypothetical protein